MATPWLLPNLRTDCALDRANTFLGRVDFPTTDKKFLDFGSPCSLFSSMVFSKSALAEATLLSMVDGVGGSGEMAWWGNEVKVDVAMVVPLDPFSLLTPTCCFLQEGIPSKLLYSWCRQSFVWFRGSKEPSYPKGDAVGTFDQFEMA